jgi:hypothetical protein
MTHVVPFKGPQPRPKTVPRVLYIGPSADEICAIVSHHIGRVDIAYETEVQAAFAQLRRREFDVVMVDQRDANLATRLILPVLQSIGYPVKPVVISPLSDISHYLAIPGVARVLAAPVKEVQFLRILGLERRAVRDEPAPLQAPEAKVEKPVVPKTIVQEISDRFMNLVSTLYKRAAFVLLFSLFIAFAFYGVLIAFFLLSSGWGAPLTLTRGHELVSKVEREITEVSVALNQTEQRLSEAALAKVTAEQELSDAKALAELSAGTITKELQKHERQGKVLKQGIQRLKSVRKKLAAQVEVGGPADDLERLFKKRLIDRSQYSASTLTLINVAQKLADVEIQIEQFQGELDEFEASREMMINLQHALKNGKGMAGVNASASNQLLLTKQSSDALSAIALAQSKLDSTAENVVALTRSQKLLKQQLVELEKSPMARALDKRIDVVFVPYGNDDRFKAGAPLYSCAFTIFFCSKAGTVGQALPGEISSVHPFFGKPIRGSFVEMKLSNPDAAMREIIHGTRKPFFF